MAHARRREKVKVLLCEVIAQILARDFQFPEGALITVTRVEISDDLFHASAFVSVLGRNDAEEKNVLDILARSAGEVQQILNRKLRMRPVPRIVFAIDQNEKKRERVEKLLSKEKNSSD